MKESDSYKCSMCGETYEKGQTDKEAKKEVNHIFGYVPIEERTILGEGATIVGGLLLVFCAVVFLAVVLWSTTQPRLQKKDKEISSITTCQTEGVVCK